MTLAEEVKALRKENREDHGKIVDRLDRMNGTQREHAITIAELKVQQGHNCVELSGAKSSVSVIFAKLRKIDISRARQAGYITAVATITFGAFQYVIMPLVKHLISG